MSLSNAFSAGIFLSAAIIHIIPESMADFDEATKGKDGELKDGIIKFPYIPTTVCMSFLFVLLIDRVIFNSHSDDHHHDHQGEHGEEGHDHHHNQDEEVSYKKNLILRISPMKKRGQKMEKTKRTSLSILLSDSL